MPGMSVQLYSVRDAFARDPGGTLHRLAEIGFSRVEPYGLVEHLPALRAALPDSGLAAPTTHAKLVGVDPEPVFEAAVACGVEVVIEPAVRGWRDAYAVAATAEALNGAADRAKPYGLRIGYHNHWWELTTRLDDRHALEVFAERLTPDVVLQVDTYWAATGGADVPGLLGRLGDRVFALHLKDGDFATDGSGQVVVGQGRMPVAEVLAAAPDALRVLEFDSYDGDVFEGLAASRAYVLEVDR